MVRRVHNPPLNSLCSNLKKIRKFSTMPLRTDKNFGHHSFVWNNPTPHVGSCGSPIILQIYACLDISCILAHYLSYKCR